MKILKFICLLIFSSLLSVKAQKINIEGAIKNYANQQIYLYKCIVDSVSFIDSITTDSKGNFKYIKDANENNSFNIGLYKLVFTNNMYLYFINDKKTIKFNNSYKFDFFNKNLIDSLTYSHSDENKEFLEFQRKQNLINISNNYLLEILRIFPSTDNFYKKLEKEYIDRYQSLSSTINKNKLNKYSKLIEYAYYRPITPNWKETDIAINDTIIKHFFDYFDPSEPFYYNTNILPEKIDEWFYLHLPIDEKQEIDENILSNFANELIIKTINNPLNYNFTINYILKKFEKAHHYKAFLATFDYFSRKDNQDCDLTSSDIKWAQILASAIRKVEVGNIAPNFSISNNLSLYDLQTDYTLVIFWASWCGHCIKTLPEIKTQINEFKIKHPNLSISIVSVSLDKEEVPWQSYIKANGLNSWLNISDFKGWQGEIPKLYNLYATPTMFLLDKQKKIMDTPLTAEGLFKVLP